VLGLLVIANHVLLFDRHCACKDAFYDSSCRLNEYIEPISTLQHEFNIVLQKEKGKETYYGRSLLLSNSRGKIRVVKKEAFI